MAKKIALHNAIRGEICELVACLHLLSKGFAVFRNMIPAGPIDFVAINMETGETHLLDAKTVPKKSHKSRRKHTPEQEHLRVVFAYLRPHEAQEILEDYHINFVNEKGEDVDL